MQAELPTLLSFVEELDQVIDSIPANSRSLAKAALGEGFWFVKVVFVSESQLDVVENV